MNVYFSMNKGCVVLCVFRHQRRHKQRLGIYKRWRSSIQRQRSPGCSYAISGFLCSILINKPPESFILKRLAKQVENVFLSLATADLGGPPLNSVYPLISVKTSFCNSKLAAGGSMQMTNSFMHFHLRLIFDD